MRKYEEYITRLCRSGRYTPEQARRQAISREVEEYYKTTSETAPRLRSEFNCLSET